MNMSFERPLIAKKPSSSRTARSPVHSQPSRIVSAVASGRRQYPGMTWGPRIRSSPGSPAATSTPSSSTIFMSMWKIGIPTEVGLSRTRSGGSQKLLPLASVRP